MMGWVLFRSDSISNALIYIRSMFGFGCKGFIDILNRMYCITSWVSYVVCLSLKTLIVFLKRILFIM